MALENLLITIKRNIGGIKVDGVITENTSLSMRVTTNPVESGFIVADHVIEEPLRYSMTGIITDTPLGAAAFSELAGSVVDAATGVFGQSESSSSTRSRQAYDELIKLMKNKELITVSTGLKRYDNLIFESISVSADKATSNGIHFSASFVQALIVETARQAIDADSIDGEENSAAFSNQSNSGFNGATPASTSDISNVSGSLG